MANLTVKKIVEHIDKDEIISKLLIGISSKDIHSWLSAKYSNVDKKLVISDKILKEFSTSYLDVYGMIQDDIKKTQLSLNQDTQKDLELTLQNNPQYKDLIIAGAEKQLDVRTMIQKLCLGIETRLGQVFDAIQDDPRSINTRVDRLLIEYTHALKDVLEFYYTKIEAPQNNFTQNNITLQVMDQHVFAIQDIIKEVLASIDLEASMKFMELFNEKISKAKLPEQSSNVINVDQQFEETKLLAETINKKINQ